MRIPAPCCSHPCVILNCTVPGSVYVAKRTLLSVLCWCMPPKASSWNTLWFLSRSLSWLTHSAESQWLSCEHTHAAQRSRLHGTEWRFFQQILRNGDWELTAMWASHPACTSPSLPQTSLQRTAVPAEMRRYPGPQIPNSATAGFLSHRNCESMNVCYCKMLHLACVCYTAWDSWLIHTPAPSSMVEQNENMQKDRYDKHSVQRWRHGLTPVFREIGQQHW